MSVIIQTRDIFIAHGWKKSEHIYKLIEELDRATEFDDQFAYINHGEFDSSALTEKDFASHEIEVQNQIKNANVVLILTDLYDEFKDWIDQELEIARNLEKPVIVIRSYKDKETPPHLEELADEIVFFDPEEILKEIKNYG